MTNPAHASRVLEQQKILQLFNCSIEELFSIYQNTLRYPGSDDDTTWTCMVYSIGQYRFGRSAWSDHHIEHFKARARENASPLPTGKIYKRPPTRHLTLADLGLE